MDSDLSSAGRTELLPKGVWGLNLQYGSFDRLAYRFNDQGIYQRLDTKNTFQIDAKQLAKLDPDAKRLIKALDALSPQGLGSNLSLGSLIVQARPEVSYWAPAVAYGIKDDWTMGFALPVIRYKSKIEVKRSSHNVEATRQAVAGLSPEIDDGLTQLANVDLVRAFRTTLEDKGYAPLENQEREFLGDVQIMSLWNFYGTKSTHFQYRAILELPTGPESDPDDLTDLGAFHNLSLENRGVVDKKFGWLSDKLTFSGEIAGKVYAPKSMVQRVPENEEDSLPGEETKESVTRQWAYGYSLGGWVSTEISQWLSAYFGSKHFWSDAERYTGKEGNRYDLLGQKEESSSTHIMVGVDLSTVDAFFRKQLAVPFNLNYEYSLAVTGKNIEDRGQHTVWLQVFYK